MKIGYLVGCSLLSVMLGIGNSARAAEHDFEAVDCQHRTVYHSPQTPGYTCWVHAWTMPDRSVMVSFCQVTGPKDGRPRAPEEIQKKLAIDLADPKRDLTGLDQRIVYLRSDDEGATWNKVAEYPLRNPVNAAVTGSVCLDDGTLIRAMFGGYLVYDNVPETGVVQRSSDEAKSWDKPTSVLAPEKYTVYPAGIRRLRDGRPALVGGVSMMPSGRSFPEWYTVMVPYVMLSPDGGKTWGEPVEVVPKADQNGWSCEECDMTELANGDLFWMFRRAVPEDAEKPVFERRHTYWQGVSEKHGDTWRPKWVEPSPFPNLGLPNLLQSPDGVVVLINAGQWTDDAGKSWHPIDNYPQPGYYPKGVQLASGRILVFAHVGSDDPYGDVDQSIVMNSFKLNTK